MGGIIFIKSLLFTPYPAIPPYYIKTIHPGMRTTKIPYKHPGNHLSHSTCLLRVRVWRVRNALGVGMAGPGTQRAQGPIGPGDPGERGPPGPGGRGPGDQGPGDPGPGDRTEEISRHKTDQDYRQTPEESLRNLSFNIADRAFVAIQIIV